MAKVKNVPAGRRRRKRFLRRTDKIRTGPTTAKPFRSTRLDLLLEAARIPFSED